MKIFLSLLLLSFFTLSLASSFFNVHQLHAMKRISEMSSYGSLTVYTSRYWDEQSDITTTSLKIVDDHGHLSHVIEETGVSFFNPTFVNKGKDILFLSAKSGSVQVWMVSLSNPDKLVQVTDLPVGINSFRYSEAGGFLILSIDVYPTCETLECTAEIDRAVEARGENSWMEYDDLFVRHWDKWETHKLAQLFLLDLKDVKKEPKNLMQGSLLNSPVPPFGGNEQFDISPDGTQIAFTGETVDSSRAWTTGWEIYLVDVNGDSAPECITTFTRARTQNPVYSPDQKTLAYLAMDRPGFEADKLHVNLYDLNAKNTSQLRRGLDYSFDSLQWSQDGDFLILTADSIGYHKLFSIQRSTGKFMELVDRGTNAIVIREPTSGRFYVAQNSYTSPNDIYYFDLNTSGGIENWTQITWENKELLDTIDLIQPEYIQYEGDLDTVQGWFFKPAGWESGKTYPLVVLIHGGPEGAWNDGWSYRWNPQLWASAGYATAMFNIHGSTGFGQEFTDAVAGNWGGTPFEDILWGVDYVLDEYNWLSKHNIFACGASYGGYMINWILGNETPFKALVDHDGMLDVRMGYYTTEELWFPEWEFKGKPWSSPKNYAHWNPELKVAKWKTPTLVIHGGKDYRLPDSQGLATFTALQRQGIPSELLYFPDENHWVLNPKNGIKWYDTVLGFLKKYTN